MIISCPNCGASFNVKPEALGPNGRSVKCSKCEHRWHATADAPEPEETSPEIAETEAEEAAAAAATDPVASEAEAADAPGAPEEEVADEPATAAPDDEAIPDEQETSADARDEEFEDSEPETTPDVDETAEAEAEAGAEVEAEETAEEISEAEESVAADLVAAEASGDDATIGDVSDGADETDTTADAETAQDDDVVPISRRAAKTAPRKPRRTMAKVLSIFVLLLIVTFGGAAFVMKKEIMMWLPASQRLYAMVGIEQQPFTGQGLEIIEPTPKKEIDGNDEILVIEGEIKNVAGKPLDVPLMRGALLNKDGKELHIWTFTAAKSQAAPGESVQYRTEFRNPPTDAETLDITFTSAGTGAKTTDAAAPAMSSGADASQKH